MNMTRAAALGITFICNPATADGTGLPTAKKENNAMPLIVTSQSFMHDRTIPARHTCDGPNISPPLAWSGTPAGTKSMALIVDDPDAPDPAAVWMSADDRLSFPPFASEILLRRITDLDLSDAGNPGNGGLG